MAKEQSQEIYEESEHKITPIKVFVAVVLFPLIPFVLIYRLKLKRGPKFALMVVWFAFLFGVYQYACVAQGSPLSWIMVQDKYLTFTPGETYTVTYDVHPDDVVVTATEYTSSDKSVCTVDEKGVLTTIGEGNATITIDVTDNHHTTKSRKFYVTVKS